MSAHIPAPEPGTTQDMKKQLPASAHIVIDKCGVATVDGGRCIVKGGQGVSTDIPNLCRVLPQAVDNVFDVTGVQLQQPAFHNLFWEVLAANANHFSGAVYRVHQDFQNFIQEFIIAAEIFRRWSCSIFSFKIS